MDPICSPQSISLDEACPPTLPPHDLLLCFKERLRQDNEIYGACSKGVEKARQSTEQACDSAKTEITNALGSCGAGN